MTKQAIRGGIREAPAGRRRCAPLEAGRALALRGGLARRHERHPAATIRGRAWVGGVVSLGRVQTPTLAMIVKREREIQAFVPEPYRLIHGDLPAAVPGPLVRG